MRKLCAKDIDMYIVINEMLVLNLEAIQYQNPKLDPLSPNNPGPI
jgi:hypothetical protein